jgi:hypothetical protein
MKKIILVLAFSAFGYLSFKHRSFREWLFMSQNQQLILNQFRRKQSDTWNAKSIEERMKGMFENLYFEFW